MNRFTYDDIRRTHGSFCFYLYAAIESFLHEVNLFYELEIPRRYVQLDRIRKEVRKNHRDAKICDHINEYSRNPIIKGFREYRNAVAHGRVYPMKGVGNQIGIGSDPFNQPFNIESGYYDILDFCERSITNVDSLIVQGWRCFEADELTGGQVDG